jgi:hypothetical protein
VHHLNQAMHQKSMGLMSKFVKAISICLYDWQC